MQLDSLPDDIGCLSQLEKLSVRQNNLSSLPSTIGGLSSLQWLHLADNRLFDLPVEFGSLSHLTFLNLDANHFTTVPDCLASLKMLASLSMKLNKITRLSDEMILDLARLNKLDLRDTAITERPSHWKVRINIFCDCPPAERMNACCARFD
jgi:leucine-rich repeat protein SHOC2